MRNLNILRNSTIFNSSLSNCSKYYVVSESSNILNSTQIFGFTESLKIYLLVMSDNSSLKSVLISDLSEKVGKSENVSILECKYVFNDLFIILSTGFLVKVAVSDSECNEFFFTELHTGSLKCASWSSDLERTVFINTDDLLFIYTIEDCDCEKLIDVSLQNTAEELNKYVNIGWGSKKTQFRGSEGKYSETVNNEVQKGNLIDNTIHICWKYNCTAFAVSYVCRNEHIRKVKIFNQDGILLNVTNSIYGLQSVIDWCPSKNLITCIQILPQKKVVYFLEENALHHGDFQLPENIQIIKLHWNSSGNILACVGMATSYNQEFVALWTTSNYKWYLKQNLQFKEPVSHVQWDNSLPNRIHIILKSGIYRMYEWLFQINESSKYDCEKNASLVAIINNNNVNFTPYRLICHPPSIPFLTYNQLSNSVNAVIYPSSASCSDGDHFDCNSAILYLDDSRLVLLQYENINNVDTFSFTFNNTEFEIDFLTPCEMSTWLWIPPNSLFFNWSRMNGNYFCVSHLNISSKSVIITKSFKLNSLITAIINQGNSVIVHSEDTKLFIFRGDKLQLMDIFFVEPCYHLKLINCNTLIALSENKNLYINETIKWRDVVSFYWKNPFLILVTMGNNLLITKVDFVDKQIQFNEIFSRSIEPKSYFVTVVDDKVLLETQRGNSEVITPRPFIIFKMEEMLKDAKYIEVFKILRKQRINMNVIFDHDPDSFLSNVKNIINTIDDSSYLLTFITELQDENVAKKMFPWKYGKMEDKVKDKIHRICDALSDSIKESNNQKLNGPLIAALVRQNKLTEAANYALKYEEISTLFHLSDAVLVYKAALASYDLECALKIIQCSKLDPSEYLPLIHELQETEEDYRKFKICTYLEKYDEALKYLSKYEEDEKFEECLRYIHKYKLYATALELYTAKPNSVSNGSNPQYMKILTIVAEFYYDHKLYKEAAILFEKADLNEKALVCYLAVGDWFSSISIIKIMGCEKLKEMEMFQNLYDILYKRGQYENAAFIAYNFIGNCEVAVHTYLIAKKYCNSINVAKSFKNNQIIGATIQSHLKKEVKNIIESLKFDTDVINTYLKRLCELREKNNQQSKEDENDRMSCISSTDGSENSSVSSLNSRASSTSSSAKRTRRKERKLWNLKRGNPREKPSLLNALKEIILNSNKQYSDSIQDLITALVKTDDLKLAKELKTEYTKFLKFLDNSRCKAWPSDELKEEGGFKDIQIKCPPDIIAPTEWELNIFQ